MGNAAYAKCSTLIGSSVVRNQQYIPRQVGHAGISKGITPLSGARAPEQR
jgi:hypothetical protein